MYVYKIITLNGLFWPKNFLQNFNVFALKGQLKENIYLLYGICCL